MASIQSKIFQFLLRIVNMKASWEKEMSTGKINYKAYCPKPPHYLQRKLTIEEETIDGRFNYILSSNIFSSNTVVLFLHGGGYIHEPAKQHWRFVYKIIKQTKCKVIFPIYPLAPNYTYQDTFNFIEKIYMSLLEKYQAKNIIVMGDSAGGGLSLALSQKLVKQGIQPPSQTILLSPWLDITMSNSQIKAIDSKDAFLGIKGLQMAGRSYAGNLENTNYLVSPIYGSLKGLGRISVFIGTHDIFFADAQKFKNICEEEGIEINFFKYDKMPHVWMIFNFPESNKAIREIAELINSN